MGNFQRFWDTHPTIQGNNSPCETDGKKNFEDQCAIRLGVCLAANGVRTTKLVIAKRHCWHHDTKEGHVLAAEELALGLAREHIPGVQKRLKVDSKNFQRELFMKKGIIFFKDYWTRKGEKFRNRSGDHIDLWDGQRLTDWRTWFLISSVLNIGGPYAKSKEIWFWRIP